MVSESPEPVETLSPNTKSVGVFNDSVVVVAFLVVVVNLTVVVALFVVVVVDLVVAVTAVVASSVGSVVYSGFELKCIVAFNNGSLPFS